MKGSRWLTLAQSVFGGAVLVAVVVALWRNWGAVSADLGRLPVAALAWGFAGALAAPVVAMLGFRALLADAGSPLPLPAASSVYLVGQLGKYLPGSVWTVLAQAQMGARLKVPRRRMAVASVLTLALAVVIGTLLGLPAVPALLRGSGEAVSPFVLLVPVVLGAVLLWPRVLNRVVGAGLRLVRREALEEPFSGPGLARASGYFVLGWLCMGLSTAALVLGLAPDAPWRSVLVLAVCGYPLAGVVGMLGIFAPAGVGVRDGMLVALLLPLLSLPAATAVVVVSRFLTVIVDVLVAGGAWLWARRHLLAPGQAPLADLDD